MVARYQVHFSDALAMTKLGQALEQMIDPTPGRGISVVCIGTDRATGDALGPLVGRTLQSLRLPVRVFGTIKHPVGANNLAEIVAQLEAAGDFVIAVDASLGGVDDVGRVTAWVGPMRPGAGVGKQLAAVGDVSILGCVNIGALAPMQVLQCTRLDTVLEMADVIAYALSYAIRRRAGRVAATAEPVPQAPAAVLFPDIAAVVGADRSVAVERVADSFQPLREAAAAPALAPHPRPAPTPRPAWRPLFPFGFSRNGAAG